MKVTIEGSRSIPAEGAYFALVPPERPWSRPAAEVIVNGATATLEVPVGEYRALAGIRGEGMAVGDPIRVVASRKNEVRVTLRPMRLVSGTVRDEDGQPLQGVTIGEIEAFVEAPLGRLSELAARHLRDDRRTTSGPDGTWSLRLPRDDRPPMAAEVPGRATTWKTGEEIGDGPLDLVVRRGAALRLVFDREAPEIVVTLEGKGETASVPRPWQTLFWARRLAGGTLEWPSLAPGEYDIYAQAWDPRTFSDAVKLGTVALEAGATQELRLQVPATNEPSESVVTVLARPTTDFNPAGVQAFGRDSVGVPRRMRSVIEKVSGGTLLYLETSGSRPPYFGKTPDYDFVILPVDDDAHVPVAEVRDLGGASLHVRAPEESMPLPVAGMATFHGCGTPERIAVPVAVSKHGNVDIPAPADCMSFVLDLEPFSPMVFRKRLALGDPEWLGEFTLHGSGRAAVRVATDEGASLMNAVVSISARGGGQDSVPIVEQNTGPDGWARFERLPAGPELTVVARAESGDASVIEMIRIEPAREKILDPLAIPKPASLVVEPSLARSFLEQFPEGHLDTLFLEPIDGGGERRSESAEGAERVTFDRLLPGRWQLGAVISSGRGYQPVFAERVDVKPGETKRISVAFEPLVFRGRISGELADLSGNVHILSSRRSDPVPSVEVSSAGEFVAILPRRDIYFVGVQSRSTGRLMWVGNTNFAEPAVPVEIRLPEGVVVARVEANGKPLEGAMVMARMYHQPTTDVPLVSAPVRTGPEGEARLEGLQPGPWVVFLAEPPDGGQAQQKSVLVSNTEVAHVDLEVSAGLAVTGSVLTAFGAPVPDAKVTCLLPGPDNSSYMRMAYTAPDGSFDAGERAPSRATLLCSVASVSGAQGYRVVPGEHAQLILPANPAALQVTSLPETERFSSLWLVARDGRVIEVSPFVPRLPGEVSLTIPSLAPGAWKLVRVSTPGEWMALTTGGGVLPPIADITLKPDERKTVELKKAGRETAAAEKEQK